MYKIVEYLKYPHQEYKLKLYLWKQSLDRLEIMLKQYFIILLLLILIFLIIIIIIVQ